MRLLLLTLAFAIAPFLAGAEEIPPGPFTFGMTREEVQAIAPSAVWRNEAPAGAESVELKSGMPVGVAGDIFRPRLFLLNGRVEGISYTRFSDVTDAAGCAAQGAMAVRNMEGEGLFNAEPSPAEPRGAFTAMNTPRGSILRMYPVNERGLVLTYATRAGAFDAQVIAAYATRLPPGAQVGSNYAPCIISLGFSRGFIVANRDRPAPVVINAPTAAELAAAPLIRDVVFTQRAEGRDYADWYPEAAMASGQGGRVVLECLIEADYSLRCAVQSEEPAGAGFGDAGVQISTRFRVAPEFEGESTIGKRIRQTMVFRMSQ